MAAGSADCATIRVLLDAGAHINAVDFHKRNALFFAAELGKADNARLLIERGIDLTARNRRGNSALHVARKKARSILGKYHDYSEVISVFVAAGVPE